MKVILKKPILKRLSLNKVYFVIGLEPNHYRIVDDDNEPALYRRRIFRIVDRTKPKEWIVEEWPDNEKYVYPAEMSTPFFFEEYFDGDLNKIKIFWNFIKKKKWFNKKTRIR